VLERVKLIAEPWDVGPHGYQAGSFPIGWTEWNGEYRDTVRRFWRGDEGVLGSLASRIAGSADMFRVSGRGAATSVNFVTAHDGYTLADLVAYEHKHNEENGEENRDGHDYNFSANYGVEGPTDIPEIVAVRDRQRRNLLATLFLSLGAPMLLAGDEIGRTQRGNNNAYCQDNAVSWFDWTLDDREADLQAFVRRLVEIRAENPVLRRKTFLDGVKLRPSGYKDITWFAPSGHEMRLVDWSRPGAHALAYRLGGDAIDDLDATTGNRIEGPTLLVVMNAADAAIEFHLPRVPHRVGAAWRMLIDTRHPRGEPQHAILSGGVSLPLDARTLVLMRQLTWDETARAHSRVGGVLEASRRRHAALS
jgi:isoamylase